MGSVLGNEHFSEQSDKFNIKTSPLHVSVFTKIRAYDVTSGGVSSLRFFTQPSF